MRIFGLLIIVVSLSIVVLSAFFGLKLPLNRTECGLYKRRRSDPLPLVSQPQTRHVDVAEPKRERISANC